MAMAPAMAMALAMALAMAMAPALAMAMAMAMALAMALANFNSYKLTLTKETKMPRTRKPYDKEVASNLRRIRLNNGKTMMELAKHLGVSHQQVQKYETGANYIKASILYESSIFLETPVEEFFSLNETKELVAQKGRQRIQLIKHYDSINNKEAKDLLVSTARNLEKAYNKEAA